MIEVKVGRHILHNLEPNYHDGGADGNNVGAAIGRINRIRANQLSRSGEPRHGKLMEGINSTFKQMYACGVNTLTMNWGWRTFDFPAMSDLPFLHFSLQ